MVPVPKLPTRIVAECHRVYSRSSSIVRHGVSARTVHTMGILTTSTMSVNLMSGAIRVKMAVALYGIACCAAPSGVFHPSLKMTAISTFYLEGLDDSYYTGHSGVRPP